MSESLVLTQTVANSSVITNTANTLVVQTTQYGTVVLGGAQGPQGIPGESSVLTTLIASTNISGDRGIVLNSVGQAIYADNTIMSHGNKFAGVSQGAATSGTAVSIKSFGEMTEPTWNWTVDEPVYLGAGGLLTQTVPVSPAKFSIIVGMATAATKLFINPMPPIFII